MCLLGMKFQGLEVFTYEGQNLPHLSLKLVVVDGYMCTKRRGTKSLKMPWSFELFVKRPLHLLP
jgi:hypothetical protein